MNIEELRTYCLSKKGVTEGFPFGPDTLVFKVMNKMFLLSSLDANRFNVKCDPEYAIALREEYEEVMPGYHMNKKLWNTVCMNGRIPEKMLYQFVDDSYNLIVASLPKKDQLALGQM